MCTYPDRDGNRLVKVTRIDDGNGKKSFFQSHWDGGKWVKGNPDEVKKSIPIYRHADVREAIGRGELVFVTEGESIADALWTLGIPAITTIGGAGKFSKYGDYTTDLEGGQFVLTPDRDAIGVKHMAEIAEFLGDRVSGYYLAGTQDLWKNPQGGMDIGDDILDHKLTKDRILRKVISPDEYQEAINPKTKVEKQKTEEKPKEDRKTGGDRLLEIAQTATYFHTSDKVAYADISIDGNRHTYAVRSKAFRLWLSGEYLDSTEKGIGSQTLQDTLSTLEAIAIRRGETREVHLRTAEHQGKIYLDLGTDDWKAIEVDASGWRSILEPPVRFWRPDSLLPLPYPVEGGSLNELKELLNVNDSSWTLIITFLLFCFCPDKTYPVLVLSAHRGSGKTAAAEIIKGLIDPGKAALIKLQGDTHKLAVAATRRHLMVYDNVSHISPDQSDDLCRISTGFGFSTRTLFTTDEETTFELTRPQIITAIDALVTRDDLADRVLMAQLSEISAEKRLPQSELNAKVEAARPRILGALLTALSQTLAVIPHTKPNELPRMADYALFAIASEKALGLREGGFMKAFNVSREQSRQIVIESSPVGEAIVRLMENYPIPNSWKGTASELLKELEKYTDEATYRSRQFPKAPNSLSRRLNRLAPDLKALGIDVREGIRSNNREPRSIVLEQVVKISSTSSTRDNNKLKSSQEEVLEVDDIENIYRPPIVHSKSIVHSDESGQCISSTPEVSSAYRPLTKPIDTNALTSSVDDVDDVDDIFTTFSSKENRTQFKKGDRVKYIGGDDDFGVSDGEILPVVEDFGEWVRIRTSSKKSIDIPRSSLEIV